MFPPPTTEIAQLAVPYDPGKATKGMPTWHIHIMEHTCLERAAEGPPASARHPR